MKMFFKDEQIGLLTSGTTWDCCLAICFFEACDSRIVVVAREEYLAMLMSFYSCGGTIFWLHLHRLALLFLRILTGNNSI